MNRVTKILLVFLGLCLLIGGLAYNELRTHEKLNAHVVRCKALMDSSAKVFRDSSLSLDEKRKQASGVLEEFFIVYYFDRAKVLKIGAQALEEMRARLVPLIAPYLSEGNWNDPAPDKKLAIPPRQYAQYAGDFAQWARAGR